jgi:hypothetical protein
LSCKDELTFTQKAIKETKKMRTVFLLEVTLTLVKMQDGQDEAFTKNLIKDLRVIKETLQVNRIDLDLDEERAKAWNNTLP